MCTLHGLKRKTRSKFITDVVKITILGPRL
jgi:hypothetical protein